MRKLKTKTKTTRLITDYLVKETGYNPIPTKFKDAITYLQDLYNKIPEENQDSARINISVCSVYGDDYVGVEIYYSRPETDEETKTRIETETKFLEDEKKRIRNTLEYARKKFPGEF
jgi:hypothetical protein